MIRNTVFEDRMFSWDNGRDRYHIMVFDGTCIHDSSNIIIMDRLRSRVSAITENGYEAGSLTRSDVLHPLSIQNHPEYGLTVLVSAKIGNEQWVLRYMSWGPDGFHAVPEK